MLRFVTFKPSLDFSSSDIWVITYDPEADRRREFLVAADVIKITPNSVVFVVNNNKYEAILFFND